METITFLPDLPSFFFDPHQLFQSRSGDSPSARCSRLHLPSWRPPARPARAPRVGGGSGAARTKGLEPAVCPQRSGLLVWSGELGKPGSAPGGAEVWWRGLETAHPGRSSPRAGGGSPVALGSRHLGSGWSPPPRFSAHPLSSPLLGDAWRSAYLATGTIKQNSFRPCFFVIPKGDL